MITKKIKNLNLYKKRNTKIKSYNNLKSDKILAKINTHKGTTLNNYYIYEILDNIDNKNNIRKYNGPIHLSDFNIKIIDHFGNLVQSIDEEFTFELEVIIQETKFQQTLV